jgi:hypothetical protein
MMVMMVAVIVPVVMAMRRMAVILMAAILVCFRRARDRQATGSHATQDDLMQQLHVFLTSFGFGFDEWKL